MKKLVEKVIENHSTKEVFLFRIACASCGTEYANKAIHFSKAGINPATKAKETIYAAMYEQEMIAAQQIAVRIAAENMNYCPICKRLVCNQCFLICDDLDMCVRCATDLNEQGQPVLPRIIDAAM